MTVNRALDDYFNEHVVERVIDKARAENAVRHLKEHFKTTLLRYVDIPASRAYAAARRRGEIGGGLKHIGLRRRASDATIKRELGVLVAAANHSRRWKRITADEMPSIELPLEARGEAPWLTPEELRQVRLAATGSLSDFIDVAYFTAGRKTSVQRLTKSQVDLDTNSITLRARGETTLQRLSVKRRPVVPIDAQLLPTIRKLMRENPESIWLFGEPKDMYRPFTQHMFALGLGDRGGPHILRHSRATHLLQAGVSIYDVARLLGDSVATVDRTYGHHSIQRLARALAP